MCELLVSACLAVKQCRGLLLSITAITALTLSLGTHVCTCTLSAAPMQHTCTCALPAVWHVCMQIYTYTHTSISQQQIYMQVNIFLPHSLVTALLFPSPPPPPQPPHLSVWEKPVGFVLSVTSCIVDVPSPEGEVPRFGACPVIPYLSKCFSYFSIKQRTIRIYSGIKRKWTNGI